MLLGFAWVGVRRGRARRRWRAGASLALLGALAFGGLGLLVASRARTIEGVSGLMNLVMLPMWVLSGVFFASSNFPDAMQPFIQALPLTALNDALRGVMNDGARSARVRRRAGASCVGAGAWCRSRLALRLVSLAVRTPHRDVPDSVEPCTAALS